MHKNEETFAIAVDALAAVLCVDNELKYKIRNGINKQQQQRKQQKRHHLQDLSHWSQQIDQVIGVRACVRVFSYKCRDT